MRKFLLGTAALVALAAPASAADLAARPYTKAPPPPVAVVYDWSGFYIGANGGWGSSNKCWDFVDAGGIFIAHDGCHDATGGVAGGQIGYRWQTGTWVFGFEGQGNWADLRGSNVSLDDPSLTTVSQVDAFGLFTGQIGYAVNNVLLYVKGGAALTSDRFRFRDTATGVIIANTNDDTRWGGSVGAGIEFGFAPNWTAGVEYNHLFMQDRTHTFIATDGSIENERIRQDVDLVTVRVNYKFGGYGAPGVIARY